MKIHIITIFYTLYTIYLQAGIKRDHLSIALKPEAAAIYCQHFMTDQNNREKNAFKQTIKDGMKYMVVDLGGK